MREESGFAQPLACKVAVTHFLNELPLHVLPTFLLHLPCRSSCKALPYFLEGEEDRLWRETAKKHFLEAYDDEDAIYDEL